VFFIWHKLLNSSIFIRTILFFCQCIECVWRRFLGGRGLERCQPVSKAVPQTHLSTIDCWVRVQLRPDLVAIKPRHGPWDIEHGTWEVLVLMQRTTHLIRPATRSGPKKFAFELNFFVTTTTTTEQISRRGTSLLWSGTVLPNSQTCVNCRAPPRPPPPPPSPPPAPPEQPLLIAMGSEKWIILYLSRSMQVFRIDIHIAYRLRLHTHAHFLVVYYFVCLIALFA